MLSYREFGTKYYCEVYLPTHKSWGFSKSFTKCGDFDDDSKAISHFLSEHQAEVKKIYTRRARVIYNTLLHAYEKEWITVPVYTRID